jgi:uncharacterized protein (TIGR04255 family)
MSGRARVKFDRPPVVEVACGVLFNTRQPFRGAYVGLYWQRIRDAFPRIEEAPPLSPFIEPSGFTAPGMGVGIALLPPLRRTWLLSEDGRNLIQVQEDRYLFNWKRAAADDKYPSYDEVIELFDQHLAGFLEFLGMAAIGPATYRQFELTYINHIPLGPADGGMEVKETRVLVDHAREVGRERFLPEPEAVQWVSVYALPQGNGRLYASARSAHSPEGRRILQLDMTARGTPENASEANRRQWFDLAHDWITHGFADITAPDVQERVWRRNA